MKIDSVDFFYAAMPEITLAADGSQDALLVRVTADGHIGWGECEAAPLVSIAAYVAPRSHGVCQPVSASVIGQRLDTTGDIARISALVARNSMDLLQAPHTYSGIEIALWDLLGRKLEQPVWSLLGATRSHPKVPYASMLFGSTPAETLAHVTQAMARGFTAVKVGWGGFGQTSVIDDADHLVAAREALGSDGILLVDAGQIWEDDVEAAAARLPALAKARATWLEEPFSSHAYRQHAELAARSESVGIAAGEGAHNLHMATNLIEFGGVKFVQIDTGRIGGIGPAKAVADFASARGVAYVNHTFTSQLALSASLQPYAGLADHRICEYPVEASALATSITRTSLALDANGEIAAPDAPGLGLDVALEAIAPYLRSVDITVDGVSLYASHDSAGHIASIGS